MHVLSLRPSVQVFIFILILILIGVRQPIKIKIKIKIKNKNKTCTLPSVIDPPANGVCAIRISSTFGRRRGQILPPAGEGNPCRS